MKALARALHWWMTSKTKCMGSEESVALPPQVRIPAIRPVPSSTRIPFGGKGAGFLVQGDDCQFFGHGGIVLGEVLANVRDDRKHFTQSHLSSYPAGLHISSIGDGTPELEKAVVCPGETVRVHRVEIHLPCELDK